MAHGVCQLLIVTGSDSLINRFVLIYPEKDRSRQQTYYNDGKVNLFYMFGGCNPRSEEEANSHHAQPLRPTSRSCPSISQHRWVLKKTEQTSCNRPWQLTVGKYQVGMLIIFSTLDDTRQSQSLASFDMYTLGPTLWACEPRFCFRQ